MARLAIQRSMRALQREYSVVVERRALPSVGRIAVAGLTIGSEPRLLMIRISGAIIVLAVTGHTGAGSAGELAVDVALGATGGSVLTLERKDAIVIEIRGCPTVCRVSVTGLAIRGKSGLLVIGIGRRIVVGPVASDAVGRCAGKLSVLVALGAIRGLMSSSERKTLVVVEIRAGPTRGRRTVTARAIGGKAGLLMIGTRRPLVVREVATHAVGGGARELSASVALDAIGRPVLASQPKGGMIESSPLPARRHGVADLALHREPGGNMVRVLSSLEIVCMATGAGGDRATESTIAVTLHAVEGSMRPLQPEAGDRFVIPRAGFEPAPRLRAMAVVAVRSQL